jgi:hypothetical protein
MYSTSLAPRGVYRANFFDLTCGAEGSGQPPFHALLGEVAHVATAQHPFVGGTNRY